MRTARAYEVFLAFQNAAADAPALLEIGPQLATNGATARLLGVDLYYRADTDTLLLGLRFDAHTATQSLLDRVADDAERLGASILDVARLSEEDRRKFQEVYLTSFPLRVKGLPTPCDAMTVFARDVGAEGSARERLARGTAERLRPRLEVHYARGDEWQLGRVRNLTREGVFVVAGATPRLRDVVEIRLAVADQAIVLRGQVVYVTPEDAAEALGAAGFGVRFLLGGAEDRQILETIIRHTLGEGYASVRAAPSRREVRYPVRWPVVLDLGHASANLAALDVSPHGLFVACAASHLPKLVEVELPIDDPGGAIRAKARVARVVPPEVARARGVATGIGLELSGLSPSDEQRYRMFVGRVSRRAERCVVVAAAPARAADIAAELVGAGYVTFCAGDPDTVIERAQLARPPDLVIVDESLERASGLAVRQLRRSLARMDVPCCFLEEEQPAVNARSLADASLLA